MKNIWMKLLYYGVILQKGSKCENIEEMCCVEIRLFLTIKFLDNL